MACVQFPIDANGIDSSIYIEILETHHGVLFHLAHLDSLVNTVIGTLKKERGDIFSDFFAGRFKAKFLWFVNEVILEIVKIDLRDTYLRGTIPQALKNVLSV